MNVLSDVLFFSAILNTCALATIFIEQLKVFTNKKPAVDTVTIIIVILLSGLLYIVSHGLNIIVLSLMLIIGIVVCIVFQRFRKMSVGGHLILIASVCTGVCSIGYGVGIIVRMPLSIVSTVLTVVSLVLLIIFTPISIIDKYKIIVPLTRKKWKRHHNVLQPKARTQYPKVSVHVPTYSEPPEMVIETLAALAALDYPNYEVLVIDNNTEDSALWHPVRDYCLHAGDTFRFFHVASLTGHKAGALNLALQHTAPDASIIGIVDADYQVKADWISKLIGYFDDDSMGFVQPPHAYRDYKSTVYKTICNWQYKQLYISAQKTHNEYTAALTVGTMCLIRKEALQSVGGWAEWCHTEDSELAIRIHRAGYSSVAVDEELGHGLIPDTFNEFKKQRYRWTCGPVQEFIHHFGLFSAKKKRNPSKWSISQKLLHVSHGLAQIYYSLAYVLKQVVVLLAFSLAINNEIIVIPLELFIVILLLLPTRMILLWLLYRKEGTTLLQTVGVYLLDFALSVTRTKAVVDAYLVKNIPWLRTNKFKTKSNGFRSIFTCVPETIFGVIVIIVTIYGLIIGQTYSFVLFILLSNLFFGLLHFSAPLAAILAEKR